MTYIVSSGALNSTHSLHENWTQTGWTRLETKRKSLHSFYSCIYIIYTPTGAILALSSNQIIKRR